MNQGLEMRNRLLILYVLCVGVLMIVLDTTIVTVALPSIVSDLRLSGTSQTWLLNAYMLTFGGFLLLSGRLGDLYGRRRLFLAGIGIFTLASIACGWSHLPATLILARAVQGLFGAVVAATSLSLIMELFPDSAARAKALGIYGFVCAGGGALGDFLGGLLTRYLDWHWIFLINLPIGGAVYLLCVLWLPRDSKSSAQRQLDVGGAVAITAALALLVYTLVHGNEVGWMSMQTGGSLGAVGILMLWFLRMEMQAQNPLVPLRLFSARNFGVANLVCILWAAGSFAWFVIPALYLQRVLDYDAFRVGLAFMPSTLIMSVFSAGLAERMVMRWGVSRPLLMGLMLAAAGLAFFARAPLEGTFVADVLPGMLLLGLGAGMASTPLLMIAMSDVASVESGLASGVVNTSFMMGGALGLAALASLAEARTAALHRVGVQFTSALNGGYHAAFLAGASVTVTAAIISALLLRDSRALGDTGSLPAASSTMI
jgi:EmrB/QacA subfamily drug resistance transporter